MGGWPLRLSFAIPRFHGQIGGVSWVEGQGGGRCGQMVPYDQQQFGWERYKNQNLCKNGTNIDTKDRQEYFVWWIIWTNHIPTNFYHIKVTYIIVLSTCICCRWNFILLFRIGNRRWRKDRLRKNCCFLCRFSGGSWCLGGIGRFFGLTLLRGGWLTCRGLSNWCWKLDLWRILLLLYLQLRLILDWGIPKLSLISKLERCICFHRNQWRCCLNWGESRSDF